MTLRWIPLFNISKKLKKDKGRNKITEIGWKTKERQEIGMKMGIITCFGDRIRSGTFFIIVSDAKVLNVFNGNISLCVFSNRFALHSFLTAPVGFYFNSTD